MEKQIGKWEKPRFFYIGWGKGTLQARGKVKHQGVITRRLKHPFPKLNLLQLTILSRVVVPWPQR